MIFQKLLNQLNDQRAEERKAELYRNIIRREAKLGGQLFGAVPAGHRREFFCLDEHTWVWHEEWKDNTGKRQVMTTRYDVRPTGVIKIQDGQPTRYVSEEEAKNLFRAVDLYTKRVTAELASFI